MCDVARQLFINHQTLVDRGMPSGTNSDLMKNELLTHS